MEPEFPELPEFPVTAVFPLVAFPALPESPPLPPVAVPVTFPIVPRRPPPERPLPRDSPELVPDAAAVPVPPLPALPELPPVVLLVFDALPVLPVDPVSPELPDETEVLHVASTHRPAAVLPPVEPEFPELPEFPLTAVLPLVAFPASPELPPLPPWAPADVRPETTECKPLPIPPSGSLWLVSALATAVPSRRKPPEMNEAVKPHRMYFCIVSLSLPAVLNGFPEVERNAHPGRLSAPEATHRGGHPPNGGARHCCRSPAPPERPASTAAIPLCEPEPDNVAEPVAHAAPGWNGPCGTPGPDRPDTVGIADAGTVRGASTRRAGTKMPVRTPSLAWARSAAGAGNGVAAVAT